MHGKDDFVEEILDWRPYDYVTDRSTVPTPGGQVRVLHTMELEPRADGTMIHFRLGAPTSKRELAIVDQAGPVFVEILRESQLNLVARLDAALAGGNGGDAFEPELPTAKPGGVLAGIKPLLMVD